MTHQFDGDIKICYKIICSRTARIIRHSGTRSFSHELRYCSFDNRVTARSVRNGCLYCCPRDRLVQDSGEGQRVLPELWQRRV